MSWARLDDHWWRDERALALTPQARDLFLRLVSYLGEVMTDGAILSHAARLVAGGEDDLLDELVEHGFLETAETGWRLVDWHRFLLSAEEVAQRKQQRRDAAYQSWSTAGRNARRSTGRNARGNVPGAYSPLDNGPPRNAGRSNGEAPICERCRRPIDDDQERTRHGIGIFTHRDACQAEP